MNCNRFIENMYNFTESKTHKNHINNQIMKLRSILCGMLAIAAAVACKPDEVVETPKLDVDKTSVSVNATAGEATFNVTSNKDWTASADADWVTVTPNNAKAAEKAVAVKVTAEDNTAEAARTATVTVKAGELSKTVKVTQAGKTADPTPEPEPEPELKVSDWAVVGSFTGEGWGWDAAAGIPLYILNDEYFVLYGQELPEGAQFKFLQGGAWGGAEVGADRTSVEPNTIQLKGGTNICLTAGGTYDLYLAADASKYYIMSPGKTPAEATEPAAAEVTYTVTGTLQDNNWNNMAAAGLMTKEGDYYVAKNVPFVTAATLYGGADQIEFKICNTGSWDGAYGAAAEGTYGANAEIAVVENGGNIAVVAPEGAYDVYFDKENGKAWVMTPGSTPGDAPSTPSQPQVTELYMLGGACDTGWSLDSMTAFTYNGSAWVWEGNLKIDPFRFPLQKVSNQWWPCLVPNADGTAVTYETTDVDNTYRVPAEGYYKVTVNPETYALTIEHLGDRREPAVNVTELYMLGSACDTGWSLDDMTAFENNNGIFTWIGNLKSGEEFRFPLQKVSNGWWPCLMISADGTQLVYGQSDNDKVVYHVPATGVYKITINLTDWYNRSFTIEEYTAPEQPEYPAMPEIPADYVSTTIWEGTQDMTWSTGMQELAYGKYNWTFRKAGEYIKAYINPTDPSAEWMLGVMYADENYDWNKIPGLPDSYYQPDGGIVVIELTDEIVSLLAAPNNGLVFHGQNVTITKVELYSPANAGSESVDNLVVNGDFENGSTAWMGWQWGPYTQDLDEGRNGGQSIVLTIGECTNLWDAQIVQDILPLEPGIYTYEYYAKSDASDLMIQVFAQEITTYSGIYGPNDQYATTEWTLFTGELVYDGTVADISRVGIQFGKAGVAGAKLWIDDFKLSIKK